MNALKKSIALLMLTCLAAWATGAAGAGLVGTWVQNTTLGGFGTPVTYTLTFGSNGISSINSVAATIPGSCFGTVPYTVSGNTYSSPSYSLLCYGRTSTAPAYSATWSVSGNQLTLVDSSATNVYTAQSIGASTPLPPPPTTQSVFAAPTGRMPTAAVSVTPSGTFGNATLAVTLDLSIVLSGGSFAGLGQFAAGYNIYVVALLPQGVLGLPAASLFVLPETRAWAPLGSPIAAYMQGLAQGATDRVVISILSGLDVTGLVGAEIYIGYGTSDTEMLAAGRYRGVYKMQ
jgi:hypothetical protein